MFLERYLKKNQNKEKNKAALAYLASIDYIKSSYPEIGEAIVQELKDQRSYLKLIASENFCSLAVQLSMGNLLTDKYSEGYPYHRFYAGCENVDTIESLAIEDVKRIFHCDHAYVQPHSGADANLVAFWSILVYRVQNKELEKLGKKSIDELSAEEYERIRELLVSQKVMGMSLNAGGHLTHGYRHNISSKMMKAVSYDVDPKTEELDYDSIQKQTLKEKPAILIAGYSAYPRLINFAKMREIANSVGATLLIDMAHFAGLVAGKAMTGDYDPIPHAHIVTSTTHKTLRGPRGGIVLCKQEFKEVIDKGCPLVLGGPLPQVMAAKAICFKEALEPSFKAYAYQIIKNAKALAAYFVSKGMKLTTGGTDNHLLVIDVEKSFGLTGRQAELALRQGFMTVNRNTVPFDTHGAWYTSGVRIGTPALTTLGMKETEMEQIGEMIFQLLKGVKPLFHEGKKSPSKVVIEPKILEEIQHQAHALLRKFPLYPEIELD